MTARVPARNLRLIALIFFSFITPFIYAAPTSTNNTEVPSSISCTKQKNSTGSVCCRPSEWTDILIFYIGNYFAHAATTRTQPGQSTFIGLWITVIALLFPMSGALKGIRAIVSKATFADTDLQTAARAGALCMVVKVPKADVKERSIIGGLTTKLHGCCKLPPGYFLMTVPTDATFIENGVASGSPQDNVLKRTFFHVSEAVAGYVKPQQKTSTKIACSYNFLKSLVAVIQALFAIVTLYNSKGHQIDRFGYAAFGLTVVPYVVMSVINLCANLICPEYPAMYLVSNQVLRNLQHHYSPGSLNNTQDQLTRQVITQKNMGVAGQRGLSNTQEDQSAEGQKQLDQAQRARDDHEDQKFEISGTVGTLSLESDQDTQLELSHQINSATYKDTTDLSQLEFDSRQFYSFYFAFVGIAAVIIFIIFGLSRFHKGSSTAAQRVWTMMWLAFGIFLELTIDPAGMLEDRAILNLGRMRASSSVWKIVWSEVVYSLCWAAPAVGGLMVVGQMISSYGVYRTV